MVWPYMESTIIISEPLNRTIEITEKLENRQVRTRHLEKAQMTSDTALIVSMKIMNGKRLDELEFIDKVFMHES
jgi:ribosome biogenesis SPOUT family RNA methylase Rps3